MMLALVLALASALGSADCRAQKWAISTNALDWANFGTMNIEFSGAVARHWTVNLSTRYNPWTYGSGEKELQNRARAVAIGARYWAWNVYSGWWLGMRAQWEEYNRGGIVSRRTEEGDAYGPAFSFGYTLMLHKNVNMEFGAGVWGGYKRYTVYSCTTCGRREDYGSGPFIMPSDLLLSFVFTF